jgi:thiol-disulfide isomerase/thioredoxin
MATSPAPKKKKTKKKSSEITCSDVKTLCNILAGIVLAALCVGIGIRTFVLESSPGGMSARLKRAWGLQGGAVALTSGNWDAKLKGKGAFVKFLAPWWGHCKSMKPDWDALAAEFNTSETVLIGDVDCVSAYSTMTVSKA